MTKTMLLTLVNLTPAKNATAVGALT